METAMATSDYHLFFPHHRQTSKSRLLCSGNLTIPSKKTARCCATPNNENNPKPNSTKYPIVEQKGGKLVVELVGAFNELTERMGDISTTTSSSQLLFKSLKLSIPLLQSLPFDSDGRNTLSKALSVAFLLADLQMDAEVISASILREPLLANAITMHDIKAQIGKATAHLLHESLRIKNMPSRIKSIDDDTAHALRKYCLTYYDIRALILELALQLDTMRNLDYLPRYHQQMNSLHVLKIYAPLAHATGAGSLSLELEDLSFRYLFPYSYFYVDAWLRNCRAGNESLVEVYKERLFRALEGDAELSETVDGLSIKGRYKSRYSTMKKLLKDGRKPEEVNDILGLRVILDPRKGDDMTEIGNRACYRTREVINSLWKEVPGRTKDYIVRPKGNGYRSLHVAVDVSESEKKMPLMEIQIRTREMDMLADAGDASHSLYKGGLTDPDEAKRLKAIMLAAAEVTALRLKDMPCSKQRGRLDIDQKNRVFRFLDKNGDGRISIEELTEVMEELGAGGNDAHELMQLLDANSDGSLSSDEFALLQSQVEFTRNMEDKDSEYRTILDKKLKMGDSTGLIQVYRKELGDKLALS